MNVSDGVCTRLGVIDMIHMIGIGMDERNERNGRGTLTAWMDGWMDARCVITHTRRMPGWT